MEDISKSSLKFQIENSEYDVIQKQTNKISLSLRKNKLEKLLKAKLEFGSQSQEDLISERLFSFKITNDYLVYLNEVDEIVNGIVNFNFDELLTIYLNKNNLLLFSVLCEYAQLMRIKTNKQLDFLGNIFFKSNISLFSIFDQVVSQPDKTIIFNYLKAVNFIIEIMLKCQNSSIMAVFIDKIELESIIYKLLQYLNLIYNEEVLFNQVITLISSIVKSKKMIFANIILENNNDILNKILNQLDNQNYSIGTKASILRLIEILLTFASTFDLKDFINNFLKVLKFKNIMINFDFCFKSYNFIYNKYFNGQSELNNTNQITSKHNIIMMTELCEYIYSSLFLLFKISIIDLELVYFILKDSFSTIFHYFSQFDMFLVFFNAFSKFNRKTENLTFFEYELFSLSKLFTNSILVCNNLVNNLTYGNDYNIDILLKNSIISYYEIAINNCQKSNMYPHIYLKALFFGISNLTCSNSEHLSQLINLFESLVNVIKPIFNSQINENIEIVKEFLIIFQNLLLYNYDNQIINKIYFINRTDNSTINNESLLLEDIIFKALEIYINPIDNENITRIIKIVRLLAKYEYDYIIDTKIFNSMFRTKFEAYFVEINEINKGSMNDDEYIIDDIFY